MSDQPTRLEVDRAIAADPATIFEVLRSPAGHVAIDASGMLMSAEGTRRRRSATASPCTWTATRCATSTSVSTTSPS